MKKRETSKDLELAYSAGFFDSAGYYLHNIGNSLSAVDEKLLCIKDILDSTEQYPQVFKLIKEAHEKSLKGEEDLTDKHICKFEDLLVNRVLPALKQHINELSALQGHMILTIKHHHEIFSEHKRKKFIQEFNIKELLLTILHDFHPAMEKEKISVEIELEDNLLIRNQKYQLVCGINNLLKNSIEAIKLSDNKDCGKIIIKGMKKFINKSDYMVIINFYDNGTGIKEEHMTEIFKAGFTTREGGYGLGLHSFMNFLNENCGKISVKSDGINKGIEFTVEIGNNCEVL
ncbi:MAG: HAMP domain-containing sensor histidine kinase [Candidatus Eremiobacterota bacterium]